MSAIRAASPCAIDLNSYGDALVLVVVMYVGQLGTITMCHRHISYLVIITISRQSAWPHHGCVAGNAAGNNVVWDSGAGLECGR